MPFLINPTAPSSLDKTKLRRESKLISAKQGLHIPLKLRETLHSDNQPEYFDLTEQIPDTPDDTQVGSKRYTRIPLRVIT